MELLASLGEIDRVVYVVVIGSFVAAFANAAFANGGAMVILAVTSTVLPITAIVPLHSALLMGSTASRAVFFREHIAWRIAGPFLTGSVSQDLSPAGYACRIAADLPGRGAAAREPAGFQCLVRVAQKFLQRALAGIDRVPELVEPGVSGACA